MELTIRPIDVWPDGWRDQNRERRPSPFRSKYEQTLKLLREELGALDAAQAHLQLAVDHTDLRKDGQFRARARATHPGVILTVVTPDVTRVFRTDRFYSQWTGTEDWHVNLRAIALGLVDLRRIDRYGLGEGAQYAGFAALPPGGPTALGPRSQMTPLQAAELLSEHSLDTVEHLLSAPEIVTRAFRWAAQSHHPDRGGDPGLFRDLVEAKDVLERSHG